MFQRMTSAAWPKFELADVLWIDDDNVDYEGGVRVARSALLKGTPEEILAAYVDGRSPWVHCNLMIATTGEPIISLRIQSVLNGRRSIGTYDNPSINVSWQVKQSAELSG